MPHLKLSVLAALIAAPALFGQALVLDAPPKPLQLDYYPGDGAVVSANPPAFVWVPVAGASRYVVQVSRNASFPAASTQTFASAITLHVPRRTLPSGKWHWRYGVFGEGSAAPAYSRTRSFEIPATAVSLPFPEIGDLVKRLSGKHPRIGIRASDLDRIRARAKGDLEPAAAPVIAAAERAIGKPLFPEPAFLPPQGHPDRAAQYTRTFQALRPFLAGMVSTADAYLLTGDERFGQEARRRLMHIMSWDPEGATSLKNNDEPGMQIPRDTARTYDYIYPLLNGEQRRKVCEVMSIRLRQICDTLRKRPFESNPFESHALGSYVNNLTEGLLGMAGDLPVEDMLEYALMQFWSPYYPPFGGEDGGWSEGPSYWSWSAARFIRTLALIEMNTGARISQRSWFRNTPFFKLYVNPPYSRMSPFGDGQDSVAGFDTMYSYATLLRNPYALWYAEQRNYRPQGMDAVLFDKGDLKARPPSDLPQARVFFDAGVVAIHTALADASRNVQFLLRSSPFGSTSHSYADQNSFVIHAYGEPLAISSGYYDYYGSPHHKEWTWQTKAHNSILVDGEGQQTRSITAKGRIARFESNNYAYYARGDARLAYPGRLDRFDRHVVFLRPGAGEEAIILMFDDLESAKPSTFQWLLHSLEKMDVDAGGKVEIRRAAARLQVRFLAPSGVRLDQTGAFSVDPATEFIPKWRPRWHLTVSAQSPAARRDFLTALLPYREGAEKALPATKLAGGTGCRAVEVRTATRRHLVLFRLAGHQGPMEAGGVSSKAAVLAVGFATDGRVTGRVEIE